jgi:putative zinc finger/helix-turn-helix YgiT family protein
MINKIDNIEVTGLPDPCPNCSKQDVHEELRSDTIEFKGLTLDVEGLKMSICGACKHQFETDVQFKNNQAAIRGAYTVERDRIRKRDGMLTGEEIARIRNTLHLNQRDAAVLFGGGHNAFNKYESGEVLQSAAMDRLLRVTDKIGCHAVEVLVKIVQHTRPDYNCRALENPARNSLSLSSSRVVLTVANKDTQLFFEVKTAESSKKIQAMFETTAFVETLSHQPNLLFQTITPENNIGTNRLVKYYSEAHGN